MGNLQRSSELFVRYEIIERLLTRVKEKAGWKPLVYYLTFSLSFKDVLYKHRKQTGVDNSPRRVHLPVIFKHQVQSG